VKARLNAKIEKKKAEKDSFNQSMNQTRLDDTFVKVNNDLDRSIL
jgi:hypothetical protein